MKASRGHNLLEVIVASMIFCTSILLFLGVWSSFYSSQTLSRNRLAAAALARALLEQKIAAGFYACEPPASDPVNTPVEQGDVDSISEIRGKSVDCKFRYQFYTTDNNPPPNNTFRKLTVRVLWSDYAGGNKSLVYETHLYRTN